MSATQFVPDYLAWRPGLALLTAVILCAGISRADRFPPDPVEELRLALKARVAPDRNLTERVQALRNLADMRRALALQEWRPEAASAEETEKAERQAQLLLVERFKKEVRQVLKQGTIDARLAVMVMLAEMGTSIWAPDPEDLNGIARTFAADLAEVIKSADTPRIREAAAVTLGQVFPDPDVAVPALGELFASSNVDERRAAASGLANLIRTAADLASRSGSQSGLQEPERIRGDVARAVRDVVPVAGRGLTDADLIVRRLSAEAMFQAASALKNQVPQPRIVGAGEEAFELRPGRALLQEARTALLPAMEVFKQQTPALGQALKDPDLGVRAPTQRALGELGEARLRLLRADNVESTPAGSPPPGAPRGADYHRGRLTPVAMKVQAARQPDPLLDVLGDLLPTLEEQVRDPNVQIRLGAVDVLEMLWHAAEPAAPALIQALTDSNRFVRWASARTLGKMGPVQPATAVPALARLLFDDDLDVRLSAATALDRFGPAAEAAVPDLIRATTASDADERIAAIRTLGGIGTGAQSAVPALSAALAAVPSRPFLQPDADARVRQTAAEVLGRFGSLAASAEPALRAALNDPNSDVRKAASDALLSILQAQK
jgi:HEAT repeat protein